MTLRNIFLVDIDFISLPTVISKLKIFLLTFSLKTVANISSSQNNILPQFSPGMGLNIVRASARKLYKQGSQESRYSNYTEWALRQYVWNLAFEILDNTRLEQTNPALPATDEAQIYVNSTVVVILEVEAAPKLMKLLKCIKITIVAPFLS